jgi:hypothetical protein
MQTNMFEAEVYPQSKIYNHKTKLDVACEQRSESNKLNQTWETTFL